MKGLLMKDLLNLKQIVRVWALLLALFIVIGFAQQSPVYISSMLTVMVLLLPVNALACWRGWVQGQWPCCRRSAR